MEMLSSLCLIFCIIFLNFAQSCRINILWDATYIHGVSAIPDGMVLPPNSTLCPFHLTWRIVLHPASNGTTEIWKVDNYEDFNACNTKNAAIFANISDVYEFSLTPGLFWFSTIYYFFTTSTNGNYPNCRLKLAFLVKPRSTACYYAPVCNQSSLSIIPQTATNTTENSTDASPEMPIDFVKVTTVELLVFIGTGMGGMFALCVCLVVMIVCLFYQRNRENREISMEFKDEKGLQNYLERFLFLEDEFQVETYSQQNTPVKDSMVTVVIPGSNALSVSSMCRAPSVTIV